VAGDEIAARYLPVNSECLQVVLREGHELGADHDLARSDIEKRHPLLHLAEGIVVRVYHDEGIIEVVSDDCFDTLGQESARRTAALTAESRSASGASYSLAAAAT